MPNVAGSARFNGVRCCSLTRYRKSASAICTRCHSARDKSVSLALTHTGRQPVSGPWVFGSGLNLCE
eukprot:2551602-Rhodomonas_salina.1